MGLIQHAAHLHHCLRFGSEFCETIRPGESRQYGTKLEQKIYSS
jgi:hypothetical protein